MPDRPGASRELVLSCLEDTDVELLNFDRDASFVLISKADDDSLSERRASFHRTEAEARAAIGDVPPGWWPDVLVDLDAPVAVAVRDAAGGDGSLGAPYAFDEDHVIFA